MKRSKKHLSPAVIMVLFAVAIAMLLGGSISGTRAALTYYSETYTSRIHLFDIGVTLLENDEPVSWRNYATEGSELWEAGSNVEGSEVGRLLGDMLKDEAGKEQPLKLGVKYPEVLEVQNTGTINQYVRVSIYKYWVRGDEDTKSRSAEDQPKEDLLHELDPDMIDLHLITDQGWLLDRDATTDERTVLYYSRCLDSEKITEPFADTLTIDEKIATKVSESRDTVNGVTTITTTYLYDGAEFRIDVEVDAVQEHNAQDAIWSAWGRHVIVDEASRTLSLVY